MDGLRAGEHAEEAEHERDRAAQTGTRAAVHECAEPKTRQRHEAADEMVARRGAGLRLEEVVVQHVEPDNGGRHANEHDLGSRGGRRLAHDLRRGTHRRRLARYG